MNNTLENPMNTIEEMTAQALQLSERALARFEQIRSSGFRAPQDLERVFEQLEKARKLTPRNPQVLCRQIYCLLSIGALEQAAPHIQRALQIAPDDSEVQKLYQAFIELKNPDPLSLKYAEIEAFAKLPHPHTPQDFDTLYDSCEDFILRQTHFLFQSELSIETHLKLEQGEQLTQMIQWVNKINTMIRRQLKTLSVEFDTLELQQSFARLEAFEQRHRSAAANHVRIAYWFIQLQVMNEIVFDFSNDFDKLDAPDFQDPGVWAQLDELMDLCDIFADEIDSWPESPGQQEVAQAYEAFVLKVQALQNLFDEHS